MDILDFRYRFVLQIALFIGVAIWAYRKGGQPEKACAATFIGLIVADRLYHALISRSFQLETVDLWHFGLDMAVLALLVPIALKANRVYPMALAAFQIIAVNAHVARDTFTQITPLAYYVMYVVPSYAQLVILACGIWAHIDRVKRFGPYRDWRIVPRPA